MKFIEAVVESSRADGRWVDARTVPVAAAPPNGHRHRHRHVRGQGAAARRCATRRRPSLMRALPISRPAAALWSEQDPRDWWTATLAALAELRRGAAGRVRRGARHRPVGTDARRDAARRTATRCCARRSCGTTAAAARECAELERRVPASRRIAGNIAMPGFTAPKLLWVREHEPAGLRARSRACCCPRTTCGCSSPARHVVRHVRRCRHAVARRRRARAGRTDCSPRPSSTRAQMPRLVEGSEAGGTLRPEVAAELGPAASAVVAGGAGDNAASAAGIGVAAPGDGLPVARDLGRLFRRQRRVLARTRTARCTRSATAFPTPGTR